MTLSDTGESRVRGYLFVLERSMKASVARGLVEDAVREVESHIRERVAQSPGMPNEREALEQILVQLGSPATVARAYSLELMMDEAATGGRLVAVVRTLFHVAGTGLAGFFGALGLFVGYVFGIAFVLLALLKPIFPHNVGFWVIDGIPQGFGARFPAPPGVAPMGGLWIIPACLVLGFAILIGTHKAARRWIGYLRDRRINRTQPLH
jgi:uncharacterized membrane protein